MFQRRSPCPQQTQTLGVSATGSLRCFQQFPHFLVYKHYMSLYIYVDFKSQLQLKNTTTTKTLWTAGAEHCGSAGVCVGWQLINSGIPILLTGNIPTNEVGNVPNWHGRNTIQSIMLCKAATLCFFVCAYLDQ
jgi:hypothetical protein